MPAAALGCVPASPLTPLLAFTDDHTLAFVVVATPAPTAKLNGVGVGVGVGFDGGVGATGALGAVHPVTLMTGIVPDDENATAHPVGAFTWNGTVRLTVPLVVVLGALGAGVCARDGALLAENKISAIRNEKTKCNLLVIDGPL